MAKTPSKKPTKAPQKRSREEEEPRETKRQKSGKEAAKAKAGAKALKEKFTEFVDNLEDGREDDLPKERRDTEELVTQLTAVRQINCKYPLTLGASGICVLEGLAKTELSVFGLRKWAVKVGLRLASKVEGGLAALADAHGSCAIDNRYDHSGRAILTIAGKDELSDWRRGRCVISEGSKSKVARALVELAGEDCSLSQALVDQFCALQAAVAAKAGRDVQSGRISLIEYVPGDAVDPHTKWHGDAAQGVLRSVLTFSEDDVAKRVMFALAEDERESSGHLEVKGDHYYLGDLVLRPGDTYVTDAVAAGMSAVGRGEDGEYAIVHKVPPIACSQFALVVDWVFV